jgi:hypothetical protein
MSIMKMMSQLKKKLESLREGIYVTADDPYMPKGEFISSDPHINRKMIEDIHEQLIELSDELSSTYFEDLAEYFSEESLLGEYVKFDSNGFQMDFIQDDPNAFDEGLAAVQETAASRAHEIESELWEKAIEDVKYIFESVYPYLFE